MTYISAFRPSPLYSHKENYLRYLDSRQWQEVKRAYWLSGRPKECWACGKKWELKAKGFNFHHTTYKNLYNEKLEDLVLFCAEHHEEFETTKGEPDRKFTLEMQTFAFICSHRVHIGLPLQTVVKYMKGLVD